MSKENKKDSLSDISESASDKAHLKPDIAYIDLPDVTDIPGQEHITVAPLGELRDVTISSADEEGESIFNGEDNVTELEKNMLQNAAESMGTEDDVNLQRASLDSKDLDGVALNEKLDISGDDLDVPGAAADDAEEAIGSEDEENNEYSLGGPNHDD